MHDLPGEEGPTLPVNLARGTDTAHLRRRANQEVMQPLVKRVDLDESLCELDALGVVACPVPGVT